MDNLGWSAAPRDAAPTEGGPPDRSNITHDLLESWPCAVAGSAENRGDQNLPLFQEPPDELVPPRRVRRTDAVAARCRGGPGMADPIHHGDRAVRAGQQ